MGCSAGMASPSSWFSVCSICAEFSFIAPSVRWEFPVVRRGPPTGDGGQKLNDRSRPVVASDISSYQRPGKVRSHHRTGAAVDVDGDAGDEGTGVGAQE